jgi:hypothetical protein
MEEVSLPIQCATLSRGQIECWFYPVNRSIERTELLALIVGLVPVATKIAMAAKHRAMPI